MKCPLPRNLGPPVNKSERTRCLTLDRSSMNKQRTYQTPSLLNAMREATVLDQLRAHIAQIEGKGVRHATTPFGIEAIDARLPGGGIAGGALHEVAGSPDLADDASATVFSTLR